MKTRITYIAADGTEFEDKTKCEAYEKKHMSIQLSGCIFVDDANMLVNKDYFLTHPQSIKGIYAPSEEQAKIVYQILDENNIVSPWDEDDDFTPGYYWYEDGEYENVKHNLEYWQDIYNNFQGA